MKRLVLIFGIFLAVFTACQEEAVTPSPTNPTSEKSKAAKELLSIISDMKDLDRLGFGSPSLFTNGLGFSSSGRTSGKASGRTSTRKLSTARMLGDSTDNDGDGDYGDGECDWTSCAEQTFTENADGSYTWTLDYGVDGCEEYGYFMKGKIIETYSEDGNTFSSSTEFVNFGDNYYVMNGTSTYAGTWEESATEIPEHSDEDSTTYYYSYSGSYSYTDNLTIQLKDSLEDGTIVEETIALESQGSESYDENGFTSNEGFTKYTLSNGDFYNTTITEPLHFSFACEYNEANDTYVFVHVSGVETTSWQEGTESGELSVNYGDGTCDNIITITENGESYDVNLGEEWENDWEEDGDSDGGVTG